MYFEFIQNRNQSATTKSFQMAMHDAINNMEIDFSEMLREMSNTQPSNVNFPYNFVEAKRPYRPPPYRHKRGNSNQVKITSCYSFQSF